MNRWIAFLVLALPLAAADISGKWNAEVNLDLGSGSPVFTFRQEGEKLTGTYSGAAGDAKLTGAVSGRTIRFEFTTEWGTVKYEGAIEDDKHMKGTADYAGQAKGTWTMVKAE